MDGIEDPYKVLGLTSGIIGSRLPQEEIKHAYQNKCKQLQLSNQVYRDNVDEDFQRIKTSFNLLMDRKRRSEYDRYLRVTIDEENSKYKRTRKSSGESQKKVDDKIKSEYRHLHHNIKELENKLKSETSESSAEPQSYDDKLSMAMEAMSIRIESDPSPDMANLNEQKRELWFGTGRKIHLLFEFASGYALFKANNLNEVDGGNFESAELEAFHRFSSTDDALMEMNAISESIVTEQLKSFLLKNLPEAICGKSNDFIATCCPFLAHRVLDSMNISTTSGSRYCDVTRALRMDTEKFIKDLLPGELQKDQVNLARLYSKQKCTTTYVGSSMAVPSNLRLAVVPHRFEGLFIAKGSKNVLCTKNLVRGQALPGENLINVENKNGTKVEYRVWNSKKSKLAAAILCGVTNIWVKPGSRVLYLGDVSSITVFQLSDLVGKDGLVYVVGLCHNIVNMAEKRPNVVIIFENPKLHWKYRMVVGMVDVIFADMADPREVKHIVLNAGFYLRTGGHYMIATQASDTDLTSQVLFAHHNHWGEFKEIELVTLEPIEGAYVMTVGGFRLLEE